MESMLHPTRPFCYKDSSTDGSVSALGFPRPSPPSKDSQTRGGGALPKGHKPKSYLQLFQIKGAGHSVQVCELTALALKQYSEVNAISN